MIMTFKTIRPAAMIIEKSSDFAASWKPIAYFAQNCKDSFPDIPTRQTNLGDVYCEYKYSSETPTTNGQVSIFFFCLLNFLLSDYILIGYFSYVATTFNDR